jgi:hypothetical protein
MDAMARFYLLGPAQYRDPNKVDAVLLRAEKERKVSAIGLTRALVYLRDGKPDLAEQSLAGRVPFAPADQAWGMYLRALILQRKGDGGKAAELLNQANDWVRVNGARLEPLEAWYLAALRREIEEAVGK